MKEICIQSKLLAKKEHNDYIQYVFEDINCEDSRYKFIMCTRLPNWDAPILNIGDIGFLKYKYVFGGTDVWYDANNDVYVKYRNTDTYFLQFVHQNSKDITILN